MHWPAGIARMRACAGKDMVGIGRVVVTLQGGLASCKLQVLLLTRHLWHADMSLAWGWDMNETVSLLLQPGVLQPGCAGRNQAETSNIQ